LYERLEQLKSLEETVIEVMKQAPPELQFASTTTVDNLMLPPDLSSCICLPQEDNFQSTDIDDFFASIFALNANQLFPDDPQVTRQHIMG
jgi:hypothetical protein